MSGKKVNLFKELHNSSKRNYLKRMLNNKPYSSNIAKKFGKDYWDGNKRFGYGGYNYIPNRWSNFADKLINKYNLKNNSKILDIGCGKGFLLADIIKVLPQIDVTGYDISTYAKKKAHKDVKKRIFNVRAQDKYRFKDKKIDLLISLGTLHNLKIFELEKAFKEINRVSKKSYIWVESFRNSRELFNLQCWALTCQSFYTPNEWIWLFKKFKYKGDYEFIFFE
jgi:ubiquinone/menaquinone biosynthesis C-methylase UbiE